MDQLDTPAGEKGVGADEERVGPLAHKRCEGRIDLAAGAGVEDLDLQPHGAGSRFHVSQRGLGSRSIGWIDEHGHTSGCGHQLAQEFQPLCRQLATEKIDPGQVAARPGEAGDKTEPDRVFAGDEDDGDRRGCRLGRQRDGSTADRGDHGDLPANQIGRQRRQPIDLILGPAVFDRHVLALDKARFLQALAKSAQTVRERVRRCGVEEPDHRHRRLLRARRERPRRRRAAEQRDELAPLHSITSSARASSVGGMSRPSALAVLRLMYRENCVGSSTGRSAGRAPLRTRSVSAAVRR